MINNRLFALLIILFVLSVFSACTEADNSNTGGDGDEDYESIEDDNAESGGDADSADDDNASDGDAEALPEVADPSLWGPYGVGYKLFDFVDEARDSRQLPTIIVYPAALDPVVEGQTVDGSGDTIGLMAAGKPSLYAIENAAAEMSGAPYPVVYFSHGSGAGKAMHKFLLEYLASHGYVCVAVDHTGNVGMQQFDPLFPDMSVLRVEDILFAINRAEDVFAADEILGGTGDNQNIAVAGHSYGGHTALALAGAQYDYKHIKELCESEDGSPDAYICPLLDAQDRLSGLLPDPRIKAVASLAHDASRYYFGEDFNGIAHLASPTIYLSASDDVFCPPESDAEPCFAVTPSPAYLLEFIGGGHLGFSDMGNDSDMDAGRMQKLVQRYITAFLGLHLKGQEGYRSYLEGEPAEVWSEEMDDIVWDHK